MNNHKDKNKKEFHWHASVSSEGTLGLDLYFPNKKVTKGEKEEALASAIAQSKNIMLSKGYLPPEARFLSSSDMAKEYGFSRQYWEKLLNEGKIPYKETAAGRITTDLWVRGYLDNKERVDEYVKNIKKVISLIPKKGKTWAKIRCPKCGEESFEYAVNVNNVNGICRAGCGFRINTTN